MTTRRPALSPTEFAARATPPAPVAPENTGDTSGAAPTGRKRGRPRLPGRSWEERTTRVTFLVDPLLSEALNELVARTDGLTKRAWLEEHIRADTSGHRPRDST